MPRGTVKKLRLYEPHYAYPAMGGHINIGIDGPWDVHRIIGTVPVYDDGSAVIQACRPTRQSPCSRSMPKARPCSSCAAGSRPCRAKSLSCVGCHEQQNTSPPQKASLAFRRPPSRHHALVRPRAGLQLQARSSAGARQILRGLPRRHAEARDAPGRGRSAQSKSPRLRRSHARLHRQARQWLAQFHAILSGLAPFVRRPGPESDYHLQMPMECHADTSELMQMLKKGHHNVKLDGEAWDRLVYLDRPERARPRHVGRASQHRQQLSPAPAGDAHQVRQSARGPRGDPHHPRRGRPSSSPSLWRRENRMRSPLPAGHSTRPRPSAARALPA